MTLKRVFARVCISLYQSSHHAFYGVALHISSGKWHYATLPELEYDALLAPAVLVRHCTCCESTVAHPTVSRRATGCSHVLSCGRKKNVVSQKLRYALVDSHVCVHYTSSLYAEAGTVALCTHQPIETIDQRASATPCSCSLSRSGRSTAVSHDACTLRSKACAMGMSRLRVAWSHDGDR